MDTGLRLRTAARVVSQNTRLMLNSIQSLLFTWECPVCANQLPFPRVVCEECAESIPKIQSPFCKKCGTPFRAEWLVEVCADCQTLKSALTATRSLYLYEGVVRSMVRQVKYGRRARHASFFGEQLYLLAAADFPKKITAIVPVPLHRRRQWARRFNQAELMAARISDLSGIPLWRGLIKTRETRPQSRLSGAARRSNTKGSFACRSNLRAPRSVLLVDDVVTTGATLEECARTLRKAGSRRVYAATVARSVLR